jgi:phasin family protein
MIMNFTPEQIASTNKAGIEAILGLAHTQFAAFERLSALYFNATKAAFEEGVGHAKALLNAKNPQQYLNLNADATHPTMEKAIAYSRSVYEVAAQTNGELAKFLEAQAVEFNKNLVGLLDKVSKNAPAGPTSPPSAVKSARRAKQLMRASTRSQSRPPRSPKRISPGDFIRQGIRNERAAPNLQVRAHVPLLLSVGALKPWRKPGLFVCTKAFLPTCRRAQPPQASSAR